MTRFYYTDPLAAAWMARHHGMNFRSEDAEMLSLGVNHGEATWYLRYSLPTKYEDDVYLVHPDSLHLLEPQSKDKVSYSFGAGPHAGEAWDEVTGILQPNDEGYPLTGNGEPYVLVDGCDEFPISRLKEIFQRDGKPFFWPAGEAV